MRNQRFTQFDVKGGIYSSYRYLRELGYLKVRKADTPRHNLTAADLMKIRRHAPVLQELTDEELQNTFYYDSAAVNATEDDIQLVREFIADLSGSIGEERKCGLIGHIFTARRYLHPFLECSTLEVQEGVKLLIGDRKEDGSPKYKNNTLHSIIKTTRRFMLWMCDNGYGAKLNEKKLHKLAPPPADHMTKTAADILTEDEVKKILSAAWNSRDRAIISVLYEAGLRSRELSELTWRDIKFTQWSVVINTAGKTGKPRYVPLVSSRQYLAQLLNDYPLDPSDPDNYVFLTNTRKGVISPLSYSNLRRIISRLTKAAGIEKDVTPHIFRHSRITHLIQQGVPETYVKKMMWGNIITPMYQTYAHIVNNDIDNCVRNLYGIKMQESEEVKKKRTRVLEPRQCPICGYVNGPTAGYCCMCGEALTDESKEKSLQKQAKIMANATDPANLLLYVGALQKAVQEMQEKHAPAEDIINYSL